MQSAKHHSIQYNGRQVKVSPGLHLRLLADRIIPEVASKGNSTKSLVPWENPEVRLKKRTEKHVEPSLPPLIIDWSELEQRHEKTLADIERYKNFPWAKKYPVKRVVR